VVRLIGALVGLGFILVALISMFTGAVGFIKEPPMESVEHKFHLKPKEVHFASDGPFGHFDRQQLQRGFQVYKEVCAACHGLNLVAFRNLADLGYSEAEVKAIANQWQIEVPDINPDTGEAATRKPIPADQFPNPYPNEVAARAANNNAAPPDLSLITKARHDGPAYLYSLLTGYQRADTYRNAKGEALPAEARPGPNLHFNPYFPNLNLAMPPPITADGQVTYADGTPATRDQMAKDVAAFLTWTAEPFLENRHRTGLAVLLFLLIATVLAYLSYKQIWATAKREVRIAGPLDPENMARREMVKADAADSGRGVEG
jgi:ubiquinol-cytochrome c reductase cytochrome c1 subunit